MLKSQVFLHWRDDNVSRQRQNFTLLGKKGKKSPSPPEKGGMNTPLEGGQDDGKVHVWTKCSNVCTQLSPPSPASSPSPTTKVKSQKIMRFIGGISIQDITHYHLKIFE